MDPGLSSTVLRISNSSFYGMPRTVSSVSGAVVILGFNTISSIVLGDAVIGAFPEIKGVNFFDREKFWKHSVAVASAGRLIAKSLLPMVYVDAESAFSAGIIHDVGMLVFEQLIPEEYSLVCSFVSETGETFVYSEEKILSTNHASVGRILADKWRLPSNLEEAMVFHHDVCGYSGDSPLVYIVNLADIIAERAGFGLVESSSESVEFIEESCSKLYLEEDEFDSICEEFIENREKEESLMESFLKR